MEDYDVIIIGGGITGAGTARDCALRGLKTLLVERHDLAEGATGRNHGLLHSGGRYAVTDRDSATECISENLILKKIAATCVDDTGGLFITLPDDDLSYQKTFIESCLAAGIKAEAIDPALALKMEPSLPPELTGAVKVPDASIDPFRLTTLNALDASLHGADILTYTEVIGILSSGGMVNGVSLRNTRTGECFECRARITVNAAGIWGFRIAEMAGVRINMFPAKGSLLIFGHRVNRMVINRCRKPANADILVPGDVVSILGTTSTKIPFGECDGIKVTAGEVDQLLEEGCRLSPALSSTRIIRAYAGVRPLVASDDDPSGRSISRGIVLLDHETRDGLRGFITITGGKLTTYRLMAEMATDLVCRKLAVQRKCETSVRSLPGSEEHRIKNQSDSLGKKAAGHRFGLLINKMDFATKSEVVCECEHVTRAEIEYAVKFLDVNNMIDLRRRTRIGMGTCQGTYCMARVADVLADVLGTPEKAPELIREYVKERWKGCTPVCWGEGLREMEYMRTLYGRS